MTYSPAHDLARYLVSQGVGALGGTAQWAISIAAEAEVPDDVVTLYDTGGLEPDTDELDLTRPSVQVRVRSKDYPGAYSKQLAIRDLLTLPNRITVSGGSVFLLVAMSSDIMSIGRDDNGRHVLTANYRTVREGA